jgi:hypothetical protein
MNRCLVPAADSPLVGSAGIGIQCLSYSRSLLFQFGPAAVAELGDAPCHPKLLMRTFPRSGLVVVHKGHRDAKLGQDVMEQVVGAAVVGGTGDDVIASSLRANRLAAWLVSRKV